MREIKGERRQRILVPSKRLEELTAARRELFSQLEDLDAQMMSVNRVHAGQPESADSDSSR